jgi:hypothetical protein
MAAPPVNRRDENGRYCGRRRDICGRRRNIATEPGEFGSIWACKPKIHGLVVKNLKHNEKFLPRAPQRKAIYVRRLSSGYVRHLRSDGRAARPESEFHGTL